MRGDEESLDAAMLATEASSTEAPPTRDSGDEVGRYLLGAELGEGGMGVVFEAYDPKLDRTLAIKLLRGSDADPSARERKTARMLTEARALAKIQHPNVVAIFDVGRDGDGIYVAMERLHGQTLQAWLESPRAWTVVRDVFVEAARGLAACHAAGLVHRDFKPANVMITRQGRVVVIDFGLAKAAELTEAGHATLGAEPLAPLVATAEGAHVGTPAYMAPEHFTGATIDARTDQFALCLALYEALFGTPAFSRASVAERASALLLSAPRPPPADSEVPTRMRAAVLRGLARDPGQRHPDLDALVHALAPAPSRRGWWIGAAGLGVALVGTWWLTRPTADTPVATDACALLRARQHAVALPTRPHTPVPHAVERYLRRIGTAVGRVCPEISAADVETDPRAVCIRHRLDLAAGLLDQVDHGDLSSAQAQDAARDLAEVAWCESVAVAARAVVVPRDPQLRRQVDGLRRELARWLGRTNSADRVAALEDLDGRATAIQFVPLQVEVASALGSTLLATGRIDDGIATLERAYHLADGAGLHGMAAHLATRLALNSDVDGDDAEAAAAWVRHAETSLALAPDPVIEATLRGHQAVVDMSSGRPEQARVHAERAIEILRPLAEPRLSELSNVYDTLALTQMALGDETAALRSHAKAVDAARGLGEPLSPELARALANEAQTRSRLRDYEGALALSVASYAIIDRLSQGEHPQLAAVLNLIASSNRLLGATEVALDFYHRALAHAERVYGPDHFAVAQLANNLAIVYDREGRTEEALQLFRRALRIKEQTLGAESIELRPTLLGLGELHSKRGEHGDAIALTSRALALTEAARGPTHPDTLATRCALAEMHGYAGDTAEADAIVAEVHRIAVEQDQPRSLGRAHVASMQIAESMGDPAELAARARRARREIDAAGLAPDAVESLDVFLREAGLLDAAP